ncbi:MAG TPA: chaplin family protein, partial [Agromyces sp.]
MKKVISRALYATLFTGGLMLLGAGVAHASETSGEDGLLSGSLLGISVDAPVTISGNGISVIGDSSSSDATTAGETGAGESEPVAVTSGDDGIVSGTQALIDVVVPVTVSGNAISVIGDSSSSGAETVPATTAEPAAASGTATAETSGEDSILGGTQALVDLAVPVTVGGNAISVIGDSSSDGAQTGVATGDSGEGDNAADGTDAWTSGEDSILGGTQAIIDGTLPVTAGGNAISVIGDSNSTDATTIVVPGTGGGSALTDGTDGLLGGTQLIPDLSLPITIGGNAISVIG